MLREKNVRSLCLIAVPVGTGETDHPRFAWFTVGRGNLLGPDSSTDAAEFHTTNGWLFCFLNLVSGVRNFCRCCFLVIFHNDLGSKEIEIRQVDGTKDLSQLNTKPTLSGRGKIETVVTSNKS